MKKLKEEEKSNQVVKGTQAIFNYEKSEASEIRCEKSCKVSHTRALRGREREREVTQKHEQKFVSIRFYLF